jgi:aldehyde dehydrogenase (NAD+)
MKNCRQFYIDGKWVNPVETHDFQLINPATEEPIATIALGSAADADRAVAAAKRAFESYSEASVKDRCRDPSGHRRSLPAYRQASGSVA